MTEAIETQRPRTSAETRLVASISAAHFVSHYFILLLPPLFGFVRADYNVSYIELGLALTAFNIMSALLQPPAGFLVDWLGARIILIGGLLIGSIAFAIAGLVDSFWVLVAMFGLAGIGNAVYHPADYSLLSQHIPPERAAKAYSFHAFSGLLGSAAAPASLLIMQGYWGWRGAFVGAAALGLVVALALILQREEPVPLLPSKPAASTTSSLRLVTSAPIVLNLVFFTLLALTNVGLTNYSVVALGALRGTPPASANIALSGYLLLSTVGVLAGGIIAGRTSRHGAVAAIGLMGMTSLAVLIAGVDLATILLIAAMSVIGLLSGAIMPSRDMIVRAITPPGSFGKVFGFVTTGFNIGGIVAPLIFGLAMDRGAPQWVFLLSAAFCLLALPMVANGRKTAR